MKFGARVADDADFGFGFVAIVSWVSSAVAGLLLYLSIADTGIVADY